MRHWIMICGLLGLCSCQTPGTMQTKTVTSASWQSQQLIVETKKAFESAEAAAPDKRETALRTAYNLSETCVMSLPEEAACYYYRGSTIALAVTDQEGYQKARRQVESDLLRSIRLDPEWNQGCARQKLGLWQAMTPGDIARKGENYGKPQ